MSRWFTCVSYCLLVLVAGHSYAYDADGSGVSDVYESRYGQILPAEEDADKDGYNNLMESWMGTNPLDADAPLSLGLVSDETGWSVWVPEETGLRFRVQRSENLQTWEIPENYTIANGDVGLFPLNISGYVRYFVRLDLAEPLNSDADGLNDWEEAQLGTNPLLSDTDDDLLDDALETMVTGSDPHVVDTDADGFVDVDEYQSGSLPNDSSSLPAEFLDKAAAVVQVHNQAAPIGFEPDFWSGPVTVGLKMGSNV